MPSPIDLFHLRSDTVSLILSAPIGGAASVLYWGAVLGADDAAQVQQLQTRQTGHGLATDVLPISLMCEPGLGLMAPSGLSLTGPAWAAQLHVTQAARVPGGIVITCADAGNSVQTQHTIRLHNDSSMATFDMTLTNTGRVPHGVDYAAAACFLADPNLSGAVTFTGRWAGEFQTHRAALPATGLVIENTRGRTSHDRFPALILATPQTSEHHGDCLGLHLGWSGNSRMRAETLQDGRRQIQAGELFWPGEMVLAAGETYTSPTLYGAFSSDGLNGMSRGFHRYYRDEMAAPMTVSRPRHVHYNTWEAVYFDHSEARILSLVDAAAEVGIERFVLDDGWFKGRRSDRAGLGDWTVDEGIYPRGLTPIIDAVKAKGMTFGLWVEPEMVNADSDLYRAHPDWVLGTSGHQVDFRNQMVLDLTRDEVSDNIYQQIDALLREYDIDYLKWDMNRDLNHPGSADGRPVTHAQTLAVYALIDRVRAAHPAVEIEACASGGGRADFGVLQRTDRIWTSDNNDALERQSIQRGASYLFPPEVTGAHVGPRDCHSTRRVLPMHFRVATAMFGHMGVEANLLTMRGDDRAELAEGLALYKRLRGLLHTGDLLRLERPADEIAMGVISPDHRHGVFSYALMNRVPSALPGILKLAGLAADMTYQIKVVWPVHDISPPPHHLVTHGWMADGYTATGQTLIAAGLQLPQLYPQTAIIFEVIAV